MYISNYLKIKLPTTKIIIIMAYTNREYMWFFITTVLSVVSSSFILFLFLHFILATQGLMISKQHQMEQDQAMLFTRVAWLAKYACAGDVNTTINIHCPTAAKYFSEVHHDPITNAALHSYKYMETNSTLFSLMPVTVDKMTWVYQQLFLQHLYENLVGPWILFLILFALTLILAVLPLMSMQKLRRIVEKRKVDMARFDKPLTDIFSTFQFQHQEQRNIEGEPGVNISRTIMAMATGTMNQNDGNANGFERLICNTDEERNSRTMKSTTDNPFTPGIYKRNASIFNPQ